MTDPSQIDPVEFKSAARRYFYQEDLELFLTNEFKIRTKAVGSPIIAFNPNAAQIPLLEKIKRQMRERKRVRIINFKGRQVGTSTLGSGVIDHVTFLRPNVGSFVVAQDKVTVQKIFAIHDTAYNRLDPLIRPGRRYFEKGTHMVLEFPSDDPTNPQAISTSELLVGEAKNINVGTGQTIHCWHLSECCRYPSMEPINDSLFPACSDAEGTVGILESTAFPAAGGAWFRSMCEKAMRNEGEYEYHFSEWWKMAEYAIPLAQGEKLRLTAEEKHLTKKYKLTLPNLKWRRAKIDTLNGDEDSFRQSWPMNFEEGWILKELMAFPRDRLLSMHDRLRPPRRKCKIIGEHPKKIVTDPDGELLIWYEPEVGKQYDIGADLAEGMEDGDWTTAEVVERYTLRQCAELRVHKDPYAFADDLACLGRFYNNAQVAPEIRPNGYGLLNRLRDIYSNIYIWRKRDTVTPKLTNFIGWETTHQSKIDMVDLARHLIWDNKIQIFSDALWQEMTTFVRAYTDSGNVTYAGAPGKHDDLIMAWLIAVRTSEDENFERYSAASEAQIEKVVEKHLEAAYYDAEGLNKPKADWAAEVEPWE